MMTEEELDAIVIRDDQVTAVHIEIDIVGVRPLRATGTAKRHPDDRDDPSIGTTLAYARALADLARQVQEVAEDRIAGRHLVRPLSPEAVQDRINRLMAYYAPSVEQTFRLVDTIT